jgi:hypothetical protein
LLLLSLVLSSPAEPHTAGFHKRIVVRVTERGLQTLVTMDMDGGNDAKRLRGGVDVDHDGRLSPSERERLKALLSAQLLRSVEISVSTYAVTLTATGAKVNLREDPTVSSTGLSVAVLAEAPFPDGRTAGMELVLKDESPDRSHVAIELYRDGAVAAEHSELWPGQLFRARL